MENNIEKTDVTQETFETASKAYYKSVHFWGQLTLILGMVFSTFGAIYFGFIKGYFPGWTPIITAFMAIFGVMGHVFLDLPSLITDVLLMGPAAKYMASLTGNVQNMRLPSALGAKAAVDCGLAGGPKEHVIASIGVIASTIVNTVFLVIMVIVGTVLIRILPESFQEILTYILPALFGAIFVQFALMNWKCAVTALAVSVLILTVFSNIISGNYQAFIAVVATIVINVFFAMASEKKKKAAAGDDTQK
ncbi:hypothetical protein KQI82_07450 [Oscillibacter sp. MSJ-2]|uniref:Uncharacterized protein n=1 Tax=Dysosmobacter acutus TaxID=2841504 RepID=A0ABS6F8Y0_9FIRM|nr:hypothetical protein [Dysosmobacter acutus]MBU5626748.1 hypothetical protein [Dysosmobacter acutus]